MNIPSDASLNRIIHKFLQRGGYPLNYVGSLDFMAAAERKFIKDVGWYEYYWALHDAVNPDGNQGTYAEYNGLIASADARLRALALYNALNKQKETI